MVSFRPAVSTIDQWVVTKVAPCGALVPGFVETRFVCIEVLTPIGQTVQGILNPSLAGEIGSGASNETVNLIGPFSDLKYPAPGQSQPRETALLVVHDQLRSQNSDDTRRIVCRSPNEG